MKLQKWFQKDLDINLEVSVLVHSLEAMSAEEAQMRADAGTDNRRWGLEDRNL